MKYRKNEAKEYAKKMLRGVWTALPTAFTQDDKLDEKGNAANLELCVSGLKLDGPTLADIYLGNIKEWDDAKIKALNSGVSLPSVEIAVASQVSPSGPRRPRVPGCCE